MVLVELDSLQDAYREMKSHQLRGDDPVAPILILVSPQADSLCGLKMLTDQMQSDGLQYTVIPVATHETIMELVKDKIAQEDLLGTLRSVFLLNCGAMIPLAEIQGVRWGLTFYVLDSHRPYNLSNVHSEQVKLLHDSLDAGLVTYPSPPNPDEFFKDVEDELIPETTVGPAKSVREMLREEDEEDLDDLGVIEVDEDGRPIGRAEKKRQKTSHGDGAEGGVRAARQAATDREDLRRRQQETYDEAMRIFDLEAQRYYARGTFYAPPIATLMYELLRQLGKQSNHDLWLSILGLTDQFLHERIHSSRFIGLHNHIATEARQFNATREELEARLAVRQQHAPHQAQDALVIPVGQLSVIQDYRFPLMRHWNLFHSMTHSPYVASRLQTWREEGREKIQQVLTEIGVATGGTKPEALQPFRVMSLDAKRQLDQLIEGQCQTSNYLLQRLKVILPVLSYPSLPLNLNMDDTRFSSFEKQLTTTLSLPACDMVRAMSALLEAPLQHEADKKVGLARSNLSVSSWEKGFHLCLAALGEGEIAAQLLQKGLDEAVRQQKVMLETVAAAMARSPASTRYSAFRYVRLPESVHSGTLARPLLLTRLAFFLWEVLHVEQQWNHYETSMREQDAEQMRELRRDFHNDPERKERIKAELRDARRKRREDSLPPQQEEHAFWEFQRQQLILSPEPPLKPLPLLLASPVPGQDTYLVTAVLGTQLTFDRPEANDFAVRFHDAALPPLPPPPSLEDEEDPDAIAEVREEITRRSAETEAETRERYRREFPDMADELEALRVKHDSFEPCIVEVQAEDLDKFIERCRLWHTEDN